jgi:glycosyltransferase involved in cell wall biosynthesis
MPVRRSVLCISYYFPPMDSSGTHRLRAIARYLPDYGWRPIVVTAQHQPTAAIDPALLEGLPDDLAVYRTAAPEFLKWATQFKSQVQGLVRLPRKAKEPAPGEPAGGAPAELTLTGRWIDWLSWWLQLPDMLVGWLPLGLWAAYRAACRHRCRAIFSSAPCWTAHLIALLTKRLTGLTWVADFRDPWRANPGRPILPYKALDRYDAWLERQVINGADWVVCNTEPARQDFLTRFPDLQDRFVTVPNGFDPGDYAHIEPRRQVSPETFVVTHAGNFYHQRDPGPVFQALRLLRQQANLPRPLCLQLLGPPTYHGQPLNQIAAEYGVDSMVLVQGSVPHREALEFMRGSDALLVIGLNLSGGELQVPAKLYEYFGVGRPVLAVSSRGSAIADIMVRAGQPGAVCDLSRPEDVAAALLRLASEPRPAASPRGQAPGLRQFHRRNQVGRIAELLAARHSTRAYAW